MNKIRIAAVAAAGLLAPAVAATTVSAENNAPESEIATYTITYRNITDAQYLTPPNFAAHSKGSGIFQRNQPASAGLEAVAEAGDVPALAGELAASIDANGLGVSGVGFTAGTTPGPIGPGAEVTFEVTTDEAHLSIASMLVCTNDGFAGLDSWHLPVQDGQSRSVRLHAFDAGTEVNTEAAEDLVPAPFCELGAGAGANLSPSEGGVVSPHQGIKGVGDLASHLDWNGPVAEITVSRG